MAITAAIERYLGSSGISDSTRRAYASDLRDFVEWFGERPIEEIDVRVLADYTADLGRSRRGKKLSPTTIARRLSAVRALVRFTLGPARVPEVTFRARAARRLPDAPKLEEVEELLEKLGSTARGRCGLRNRALVELVYSAGLRSAEAVGLDLGDIDHEQERVHVRLGKGAKERVVPLGEEAGDWVARYLRDARPLLVRGAGERALPLGRVAGDSTRRRCAGSLLTPTATATRSQRTSSRAAPTCA